MKPGAALRPIAEQMIARLGPVEDRIFRRSTLTIYAVAILAFYLAYLVVRARTHTWILDSRGQPLFSDFVWMWSGSYDVLTGHGARVFDDPNFAWVQGHVVGAHPGRYPYFHWVYPPTELLMVAPLAALPYPAAFLVWVCLTLALYAAAVWFIQPRPLTILLALTQTAVMQNVLLGQNGLLSAALLGFFFVLLEKRPVIAALPLSVLSFKPQLGLLFPIVLALGGYWKTFVAAGVGVAVLALTAGLAFGFPAWADFFRSFAHRSPGGMMTDANITAVLHSPYGLMIWAGAPTRLAWLVHTVATALGSFGVVKLWRGATPMAIKGAALALGTISITPYLLSYDLILFSIPAILMIKHGLSAGFLPGERSGIALCCVLELVGATAPVGVAIAVILATLIARRALGTGAARLNQGQLARAGA
jgi:hypothetical protein